MERKTHLLNTIVSIFNIAVVAIYHLIKQTNK